MPFVSSAYRRFIAGLAVMASIVLSTASLGQTHTKLFILAGQSNAVNNESAVGDLTGALAPYAAAEPGIPLWYSQGLYVGTEWRQIDSGGAFVPLAPQAEGGTDVFFRSGVTTGFGPELSLGRALADGHPDCPVAIVKVAFGSTSLARAANDPNGRDTWHPDETGQIYDHMVAQVNAAMTELTMSGDTASVEGLFWEQGENDTATETMADNYQQNLADLFAAVRSEFNPDMVAVTWRLPIDQQNIPGIDVDNHNTIRAAQVAVGEADPLNAWIDADDFDTLLNHVHTDAADTIAMGERFAAAYFATVPEPSSALLLVGTAAVTGMRRRRVS